MYGDEVRSIGDRIATLTVAQATGLGAYLKEAYGIEPARGVPAPAPVPSTPLPHGAGESAVVDIVLTSAGDKKIQVIKVVRQHTGLGLKEAKDLVDGVPSVVKAGLDRPDAEKLRADLVAQGATVELK